MTDSIRQTAAGLKVTAFNISRRKDAKSAKITGVLLFELSFASFASLRQIIL
jgi:hypothetical protein